MRRGAHRYIDGPSSYSGQAMSTKVLLRKDQLTKARATVLATVHDVMTCPRPGLPPVEGGIEGDSEAGDWAETAVTKVSMKSASDASANMIGGEIEVGTMSVFERGSGVMRKSPRKPARLFL